MCLFARTNLCGDARCVCVCVCFPVSQRSQKAHSSCSVEHTLYFMAVVQIKRQVSTTLRLTHTWSRTSRPSRMGVNLCSGNTHVAFCGLYEAGFVTFPPLYSSPGRCLLCFISRLMFALSGAAWYWGSSNGELILYYQHIISIFIIFALVNEARSSPQF